MIKSPLYISLKCIQIKTFDCILIISINSALQEKRRKMFKVLWGPHSFVNELIYFV